MESIIRSRYNKSTKVIEATFPRANPNSTLVPHKDKLNIVYDLYTPTIKHNDEDKACVNLLFLHGSGMNRCVWEFYVAHILDYDLNWHIKKIILVDQVTHGDSAMLNHGKLGVDFDWSDGARDACKIAAVEFFDGTVARNIVIGHSMGGFQALCCGVLMPNLFQLIITIEPVVLMPNLANVNNRAVLPTAFYDAISSKIKDSFEDTAQYEEFMIKHSFFKAVHPEILRRMIEFEKLNMPDGTIKTKIDQYQNIICYLTLFPTCYWLMNSLKFIKVPVVSILGDIARWSPKENQDTLKRLIPHYTQDVIADADHLMNIEKPDETLSRLVWHISTFITSEKPTSDEDLSIDKRQEKFSVQFRQFRASRVENGPMVLAKF